MKNPIELEYRNTKIRLTSFEDLSCELVFPNGNVESKDFKSLTQVMRYVVEKTPDVYEFDIDVELTV